MYQNQAKGKNKKRCIVGEIRYRLGLKVPGPKVFMGADDAAKKYNWDREITEAGLDYLVQLQDVADDLSQTGRPWGEIKNVYDPYFC